MPSSLSPATVTIFPATDRPSSPLSSLPLPLYFFLTFSWQHNTIWATGGPLPSTHRGNQLSGCRSEGGNSLTAKLPPLADVDGEWEATEEWQWNIILRPLPPPSLGPKRFISTPSSQWYPSFMTKVSGLLECIFVHKQQTLSLEPSQMKPYFEVTISNSYSW